MGKKHRFLKSFMSSEIRKRNCPGCLRGLRRLGGRGSAFRFFA
jgi:hypothetical protein